MLFTFVREAVAHILWSFSSVGVFGHGHAVTLCFWLLLFICYCSIVMFYVSFSSFISYHLIPSHSSVILFLSYSLKLYLSFAFQVSLSDFRGLLTLTLFFNSFLYRNSLLYLLVWLPKGPRHSLTKQAPPNIVCSFLFIYFYNSFLISLFI